MLNLSSKWAAILRSQPETGMGYQIASVLLKDGTSFHDVMIVGGSITGTHGRADIPFDENEIAEIMVTS